MNLYYSIIVPAYNAEKYMRDCINSVLSQKYHNFELIIIDDGSTDNTREIVAEFSEDKRIKYLYQKNAGVSSARNRGILESKGDYICFVDADDIISSMFLKVFDDAINNVNPDVIYCDNYDFFDNNIPTFSEKACSEIYSILTRNYDFCSPISHSTVWGVMFSSKITKDIRFRQDIFVAEDSMFFANALLKCQNVYYLDNTLYGYRKHNESVTGTKDYNEKKVTEIYAWREIAELVDIDYKNSIFSVSSHASCGMNAYKGLKLMKKKNNNPMLWDYCLNTMREKVNYIIKSNIKFHNKIMYSFVCVFPSLGIKVYDVIKNGG